MGCIHYAITHPFFHTAPHNADKSAAAVTASPVHLPQPLLRPHPDLRRAYAVIAREAQATYTILSNRIVSIPVADTDASRPGYPPLERMLGMHTGARGKQLRCKNYRYESRVIKN